MFWLTSLQPEATQAQTNWASSPITSIDDLDNLVAGQTRWQGSLALTGIVCAASETGGALALTNDGQAEVFYTDFQGLNLMAGQQVALVSPHCEIIRRPNGLALQPAALVENDGVHGVREKSATVSLAAGNYPIRLDWFTQFGSGSLSVEFSGPGIPRQKIPGNFLSHSKPETRGETTEMVPGVRVDQYAGSWPSLPDFGQWPVAESGDVTNFALGRWEQAANVGLEFSGNFQVPRPGNYTFYLKSSGGSRLYLGTRSPIIRLLDKLPAPEPMGVFIGSVFSTGKPSLWARHEGFVRYIAKRSGRTELELRSSSNSRMEMELLDDTGFSADLLMNSKIMVAGVARAVYSTAGQEIWGLLTVMDRRDIHIMQIAPEVWAAYPVRSPSEVVRQRQAGHGEIVHAFGWLAAGEGDGPLVLKDAGASLLVEHIGEAVALAGHQVEVIGICNRSGTNGCLTSVCLRNYSPAGNGVKLPLLTTASQVAQLGRNESGLRYPVHLRGVVTCIWPDYFRNFVLQDSTRGVFVQLTDADGVSQVHPGDYLEIQGYTAIGTFSPIVRAPNARYLGGGRFPEPVHPAWDQLVNGSLDDQYVEIEGIITDIQSESLTFLTHWGKISVSITDQNPAVFAKCENRLVRMRGCLLALWDDRTHQVKNGGIRMQNAILSVDEPPPVDSFATPPKTLTQLRQFDVAAAAFHQVHVIGNIVARRGDEFFMMDGSLGLRFIADGMGSIKPGNRVEVVGYPELGGPSPVLRDAMVRKTGDRALPAPKKLSPKDLTVGGLDATRVQIDATLLSQRMDRADVLLEMEVGLRPFLVRYPASQATQTSLRPGSQLDLTGVYVSLGNGSGTEGDVDSFELLLDSPAAIKVLSEPPWWTLKRLVLAVGALSLSLSLVALWVVQLRRQVDSQTKIIREKAEREATLEERTRIARELHDTLEQALAGISLQLRAFSDSLRELPEEPAKILSMARQMVRHGQQEARRTVRNLRTHALQNGGLSGALAGMAREMGVGLPVKIEVEVVGRPVPLASPVESHLLRVTQEAMTNALKHAHPQSIQIRLTFAAAMVRLEIRDDGCGFDVTHAAASEAGHFGLLGMRERAEKIHGTLAITSTPGQGTAVMVTVRLGDQTDDAGKQHEEKN